MAQPDRVPDAGECCRATHRVRGSRFTRARDPGFETVWVPVIACATLIFVLSGIPSLSTGLGTWDLVLRKLAHVSIYGVLGGLLLRALGRNLATVVGGVAYAVTDEVHQHFVPGRSGAPLDVAFDALGVIAGVIVLRWLRA
jgi:VanZ like family